MLQRQEADPRIQKQVRVAGRPAAEVVVIGATSGSRESRVSLSWAVSCPCVGGVEADRRKDEGRWIGSVGVGLDGWPRQCGTPVPGASCVEGG